VADVIFVLVILAFFALCVWYVRGCERIIAPGDAGADSASGAGFASAAPAPAGAGGGQTTSVGAGAAEAGR
jgi:hypothetical protein